MQRDELVERLLASLEGYNACTDPSSAMVWLNNVRVDAANLVLELGADEITRLRALSVERILVAVTPGEDGMGHEVYAKSVEQVETLLGEMGGKLEDYELGITRLRAQVPDADAERFRWLITDHADREVRERCRGILRSLGVMGEGAARAAIDAAMSAAPTPQKGVDGATAKVDGWEALADQDDADLEAYLGDRP